jgi:hypothetical protein
MPHSTLSEEADQVGSGSGKTRVRGKLARDHRTREARKKTETRHTYPTPGKGKWLQREPHSRRCEGEDTDGKITDQQQEVLRRTKRQEEEDRSRGQKDITEMWGGCKAGY